MFIALLGRQPEISLAELSAIYGEDSVKQVAQDFATIKASAVDISRLGGTVKVGEVIHRAKAEPRDQATLIKTSEFIVKHYYDKWQNRDSKITLGLSVYNLKVKPQDVQKTGLILKTQLKKAGVSMRLIPNTETHLSTAASHNNRLGLSENKVELIITCTYDNQLIIAESHGTQNITAYTRRDQARPKRDAFIGMLPPKLAQIMLNLALGNTEAADTKETLTVLDPFCGTGVVLQEALLRGISVYGSDLNPKMVEYTKTNLEWLQATHKQATGAVIAIREGDAMSFKWPEAPILTAVVGETYLGQPFSAPPSPVKLKEVVGNCNHIISSFLKNLHHQLATDTPLCIAVPAWRDKSGSLTHLPLIQHLDRLGYKLIRTPLVYAREDQVVARELLVLKRQQ